jgi:hypothetical protein
MSVRLASSVLVSGLIAKAEGEGGFGAVLAKGDPTAGSIVLILAERGGNPRLFERILQPDGGYAWQPTGQPVSRFDEVAELIARRKRSDPDLWVVELDIPSAERFAAEMNAAV